jgi:archaeoflavoprotein AfpA
MARVVRVAWGITGSGDRLRETLGAMQELVRSHPGDIEVEVFLSKAGEQIARMYGVLDELRAVFPHVWVEQNANSPFVAGRLHKGEFILLLVAPASSNTVAKVLHGIADTLLTNGTIQALKARVPVYVMPTDLHEGEIATTLPDGRPLKMRVRREDAENSRALARLEGVSVLEGPDEIPTIVEGYLKAANP